LKNKAKIESSSKHLSFKRCYQVAGTVGGMVAGTLL
jgi:hypothetical protein